MRLSPMSPPRTVHRFILVAHYNSNTIYYILPSFPFFYRKLVEQKKYCLTYFILFFFNTVPVGITLVECISYSF